MKRPIAIIKPGNYWCLVPRQIAREPLESVKHTEDLQLPFCLSSAKSFSVSSGMVGFAVLNPRFNTCVTSDKMSTTVLKVHWHWAALGSGAWIYFTGKSLIIPIYGKKHLSSLLSTKRAGPLSGKAKSAYQRGGCAARHHMINA